MTTTGECPCDPRDWSTLYWDDGLCECGAVIRRFSMRCNACRGRVMDARICMGRCEIPKPDAVPLRPYDRSNGKDR